MDEALDLVRKTLGQNHLVVESKEVETRRLLPWPSTRQEIEISAQRLPRGSQSSTTNSLGNTPAGAARKIRTLAEVRSAASAAPAAPKLLAPIPSLPPENDDATATASAIPIARVVGRQIIQNVVSVNSPESSDLLDRESLHAIVSRLERQSRPRGMSDIPHDLFQHYQQLREADVADEVARELIADLRQHASTAAVNSPTAALSTLTALIERQMRCSPPIQVKQGRRQIVSLIGPTGVGKTTTLAKLAGQFHLNEGLRVAMITVDHYRVGAIQQLRSYAEILQVPFRTAANAEELRQTVDELDNVDLVLIDTAGRSPLDRDKLIELQQLLQVIPPDHVLLVMSLAMGQRMLTRVADQFAIASPTSLVLTKLDEVMGHGGLLSVARNVPYPVSYLTTGQEVPDRIEPRSSHAAGEVDPRT